MRCTLVLFGLLVALLTPDLARGYTLNSSNPEMRGWDTSTLRVNYNLADCPKHIDFRLALGRAMKVWNDVSDRKVGLLLGETCTTSAEVARGGKANDSPLLVCDTSFGHRTGMDVALVPAVGGIAYDTDSNNVIYGYILLNMQPDALAGVGGMEFDELVIVLAHELGHVLGLGHSEDPNALMYHTVARTGAPVLAQDDLDGLHFLYRERPKDEGPFACVGVERPGNGRPSDVHGAVELALLLLLCFTGTRWLSRES